jgi:hypothetical protein
MCNICWTLPNLFFFASSFIATDLLFIEVSITLEKQNLGEQEIRGRRKVSEFTHFHSFLLFLSSQTNKKIMGVGVSTGGPGVYYGPEYAYYHPTYGYGYYSAPGAWVGVPAGPTGVYVGLDGGGGHHHYGGNGGDEYGKQKVKIGWVIPTCFSILFLFFLAFIIILIFGILTDQACRSRRRGRGSRGCGSGSDDDSKKHRGRHHQHDSHHHHDHHHDNGGNIQQGAVITAPI